MLLDKVNLTWRKGMMTKLALTFCKGHIRICADVSVSFDWDICNYCCHFSVPINNVDFQKSKSTRMWLKGCSNLLKVKFSILKVKFYFENQQIVKLKRLHLQNANQNVPSRKILPDVLLFLFLHRVYNNGTLQLTCKIWYVTNVSSSKLWQNRDRGGLNSHLSCSCFSSQHLKVQCEENYFITLHYLSAISTWNVYVLYCMCW